MRHRKNKKTLSRSKSAREAVMRDLATSLIVFEKVKTTQAKAKTVRPIVERLITKAKAGNLTARRELYGFFTTRQPVNKMIEVIGPRYKYRTGGYTRITKIGPRQGDGAEMAIIELVK